MRTVTITMQGEHQIVEFPKEMQFEGLIELEISKVGDVITLQPVRPSSLRDHDETESPRLL